MKKTITFILAAFGFITMVRSQTTRLGFDQGQQVQITIDTKTTISQQAMGQSIDFNVAATGVHTYAVTNATDDNTTLHHLINRIKFSFDGMGQKMAFDSDNEKDLNGRFGKPIKEMKEKTYDMVIDPDGTVLMAFPDSVKLSESDSRLALISTMLKEVLDMVQPPKKGTGSFFKVVPGKEVVKTDTWTENITTPSGKSTTNYTVSDITDSTIVVAFTGTASMVTKAEMMCNETTTTMSHRFTGTIIVDKKTRLIRRKDITLDGTGQTESGFGSIPVTSLIITAITVAPPPAAASN